MIITPQKYIKYSKRQHFCRKIFTKIAKIAFHLVVEGDFTEV